MHYAAPPPLKSLISQVQLTYCFLCLQKEKKLHFGNKRELTFMIHSYLTILSELKHIAIGLEGTLRGHKVHLYPKQ